MTSFPALSMCLSARCQRNQINSSQILSRYPGIAVRHEAVILPSRKFVFKKKTLTNHLKQKTHIHKSDVCFLTLQAQDVVGLKANTTIGRNIFKNSLKVLKKFPISYGHYLIFITSHCITATNINCDGLHMLKDIELR